MNYYYYYHHYIILFYFKINLYVLIFFLQFC